MWTLSQDITGHDIVRHCTISGCCDNRKVADSAIDIAMLPN